MSGINRVAVMREAITKITQILSDKGIRVTQQGIQAFVQPDANGKPVRVNLPYIPDEAPEELISAIQGFLDHEVAHVMFSDFSVLDAASKGNYKFFLNALEDTRIERNMGAKFQGSAHNLATTLGFFLDQYIEPKYQKAIADGDTVAAAQVLFVPLIRALSGQLAAKEYLADKVSNSMQNFPVLGWKQRPIVSTPVCNHPVFLPGVVWSVLHGHYLRNTPTPRGAEAIDFCHCTGNGAVTPHGAQTPEHGGGAEIRKGSARLAQAWGV